MNNFISFLYPSLLWIFILIANCHLNFLNDFSFQMLDPVYPGQEFPLPLHLAEAGRMRWRPLGNAYLWSEAYNISNILAHENGIGFLRSVVCYPSHPSSDPFRFCISVHDMCLPAFGRPKGGASIYSINTVKQSVENSHQVVQGMDESKKRFLHLVTLSSPLVVNNYLPLAVTLAIESGGVTRTALLSEVCSICASLL